MFRLLSCYWFLKNIFLQSDCLLFRNPPLDTFLLQIWPVAGTAAGGGAGHTSLEFLGLHNNGFVYGCFCKSPL